MSQNHTSNTQQTRRRVLKLAGASGFALAVGNVDAKEVNETVNLVQFGIKHQILFDSKGSEEPVRYAVDMSNRYNIRGDRLYVLENTDNSDIVLSNEYVAAPQIYDDGVFEQVKASISPYNDSKVLPVELSSDLRPVEGIPVRNTFDYSEVRIIPKSNQRANVEYNSQQLEVSSGSSASIESEKQKVEIRIQAKNSESESNYASATTIPHLMVKNHGEVTIQKIE